MAASNVRLFVTCDGTPHMCAHIRAVPAQMDEQGRYVLDKPGTWYIYTIYNDEKIRIELTWTRTRGWKVWGIYKRLVTVVPEKRRLLVSVHTYPLGCYRVLDVRDTWQDGRKRFILDKPGLWDIMRIANYKTYRTCLYVHEDGTWEFVDDADGFSVLTE